jgi:hypothetical protein
MEAVSGGPVVPDHKAYVEKKLYDEGIADTYGTVLPESNQLLIDYDVPELPDYFQDRMNILLEAMNAPVRYQVYASRHGRRHVIVTCEGKKFDEIERVAWQAALGSDSKREALSLRSIALGAKNSTLLIHRKDGADAIGQQALLEPVERKFR